MAVYKYNAKKGPQESVEGKIEAQSQEEAIEKINRLGYIPVRIKKEEEARKTLFSSGTKLRLKVKSRQITVFSRQLSSLLKAGVPILNALGIISEQSEDINLKNIVSDIYSMVKQGTTFSQALSSYPKVFSSLYIAMVAAGEGSGALPAALIQVADHRAKQEAMISRLRMALIYPMLMALVGTFTVIFMLTFVMPRLMQIFTSLGQNLPLPTQILISTSQWLRQWWPGVIIGLIIVVLTFRQQAKTKIGKVALSSVQLHIPLFGNLVLKAELSRFSRTLELLIRNGIPILKAIAIAIPVLDNDVLKNKLMQSYKELEQGGSFGLSLKNSRLFPSFMSNLISVGEESGSLDDSLAEIANSYETDTDEAIKVMSSLLEPVMILGVGLVVGFIVIAMLLPIFEINMMAP